MDMVAKRVFQYEIEKLQLAYVKGLLSLYYVFRALGPLTCGQGPNFYRHEVDSFPYF
jgi:hypothetical protein